MLVIPGSSCSMDLFIMEFIKLLRLFGLFMPVVFLAACEPVSDNTVAEQSVPAATTGPAQEDQRLAAFFDEIFERDVSRRPEFQAYLGRKTEDYGRWDDYSDEYAQADNQQTAADLERLHAEFDYAALSESSKISYRIFEYNQMRSLRNFEWRFHNYAISPMNDIASDLPTLKSDTV